MRLRAERADKGAQFDRSRSTARSCPQAPAAGAAAEAAANGSQQHCNSTTTLAPAAAAAPRQHPASSAPLPQLGLRLGARQLRAVQPRRHRLLHRRVACGAGRGAWCGWTSGHARGEACCVAQAIHDAEAGFGHSRQQGPQHVRPRTRRRAQRQRHHKAVDGAQDVGARARGQHAARLAQACASSVTSAAVSRKAGAAGTRRPGTGRGHGREASGQGGAAGVAACPPPAPLWPCMPCSAAGCRAHCCPRPVCQGLCTNGLQAQGRRRASAALLGAAGRRRHGGGAQEGPDRGAHPPSDLFIRTWAGGRPQSPAAGPRRAASPRVSGAAGSWQQAGGTHWGAGAGPGNASRGPPRAPLRRQNSVGCPADSELGRAVRKRSFDSPQRRQMPGGPARGPAS